MMDLQCSSRSEAIGLGSITFTPNLEAGLQKPISKCGPVNLSAFIRMSSAIQEARDDIVSRGNDDRGVSWDQPRITRSLLSVVPQRIYFDGQS